MIIIEIRPQRKDKPFLFDEYELVVNTHTGRMTLHLPKANAREACCTAFMLADVLEFAGADTVKFSTLAEDEICTDYVAAYRKQQEKEAAANANSNRPQI